MQTGKPSTKVDRMPRKSAALRCAIATRRHVMLLLCLSCAVLLHIPAAHADVIADCNQTDSPERAIRACSTYLEDRTATPQIAPLPTSIARLLTACGEALAKRYRTMAPPSSSPRKSTVVLQSR